MHAIHGNNLGSCPLNLCLSIKDELKFRRGMKIPYSEEPIMLIGVGYLKKEFKGSSKKSVQDLIK